MVAALLLLFFEELVLVQGTLLGYRYGLKEAIEHGIGLCLRHLRSEEAYERYDDEAEYHGDGACVNRGGDVTEHHVGYGDAYTEDKAGPYGNAGNLFGIQAVQERS